MRAVFIYLFVNGYKYIEYIYIWIKNIMITCCYKYTQKISWRCVYYYSEFLFLIVNGFTGEAKLYDT